MTDTASSHGQAANTMTRITISEKPGMGRAIAFALGIKGTGRSFIQGGDVIVTWCVGHLVTAIGPEGYDPALKSWKLDTLPFFPEPFRYAPIEATRDQYEVGVKLITRDDVVDVVNATDAGRCLPRPAGCRPQPAGIGLPGKVASATSRTEKKKQHWKVSKRKKTPAFLPLSNQKLSIQWILFAGLGRPRRPKA